MSATARRYRTLFLCTGNSARSILAEAILARRGAGRFEALSAGSHPRGSVDPLALEALVENGFDVAPFRSKSWDELASAPALDFVFTVCDAAARETCPVWPGEPVTANWAMPDPAAATGTLAERRWAFRRAYAELDRRIEIFTSLSIESLGRLALARRVAEIGRS
jgi:protein-tyrosine-phosphatase